MFAYSRIDVRSNLKSACALRFVFTICNMLARATVSQKCKSQTFLLTMHRLVLRARLLNVDLLLTKAHNTADVNSFAHETVGDNEHFHKIWSTPFNTVNDQ